MRRANKRFRPPPHLSLGSPTAMAELDLSEEVTQRKVLKSTLGDMPDCFQQAPQLQRAVALHGV